jgi:hypothetical protein
MIKDGFYQTYKQTYFRTKGVISSKLLEYSIRTPRPFHINSVLWLNWLEKDHLTYGPSDRDSHAGGRILN